MMSLALAGTPAGMRADDPLASPESVGFSSAGLKTFQQSMRALVDEHQLVGVTTLVVRHGKVVHVDAYGVQDLESKKPVTKDTILPHRLDDQAARRRGDDDAEGRRDVDAR